MAREWIYGWYEWMEKIIYFLNRSTYLAPTFLCTIKIFYTTCVKTNLGFTPPQILNSCLVFLISSELKFGGEE
jgi:hypothetical protein